MGSASPDCSRVSMEPVSVGMLRPRVPGLVITGALVLTVLDLVLRLPSLTTG